MARRSSRRPTVSSPLALLAALEPGRHATSRAMAELVINGRTYAALGDLHAAMDRLAAEVGHAGHFAERPPRMG